jgi:hypothetical protein
MPNKPENAFLIEEWKNLRDEISRKQSFVERLILASVGGNLAIFSLAATGQIPSPVNAFVALLPIILTTLSYFWILRNFYSGARIASYIKEIIEPKTGLGWETWLNSLRRETEPGGKITFRADIFSVYFHSLMILSLIVCIVLIWAPYWSYIITPLPGAAQTQQLPLNPSLWLTGIAIAFWLIWYIFVRIAFINQNRKDIRQLMQAIQKQDKEEKK